MSQYNLTHLHTLHPAAVVVDRGNGPEIVHEGAREECEYYAESQTDGHEYLYCWADRGRLIVRRAYVDGEVS